MSLKKLLTAVMMLIAVIVFVSCENGESGSEGFYVRFTFDGADYDFKKGFADIGSNDPFGNISGDTWIAATPDGPATDDSADYILIGFDGSTVDYYYNSDINIIIHIGSAHWSTSGNNAALVITEYGEADGVITGSFIGLFDDGDIGIADGHGTFRVKRYADNTFAPQ